MSSTLTIAHAARHDSGVYRCRAENSYGRDELLIYLAVQGEVMIVVKTSLPISCEQSGYTYIINFGEFEFLDIFDSTTP